jgi:hypothetical protein
MKENYDFSNGVRAPFVVGDKFKVRVHYDTSDDPNGESKKVRHFEYTTETIKQAIAHDEALYIVK